MTPAYTPAPDQGLGVAASPTPTDDPKTPKEPKLGDFDAGGQVRLPSGPDEQNQYAAFNWIALDLQGTYFLHKWVKLTGTAPLAVKKPDMLTSGADPRLIGGMSVSFEAKMEAPKMPFVKYDTEIGIALTASYMRAGAMLLSDKDFPLFVGGFEPGLAAGLITKVKLSSLVDFSLVPSFVFQTGEQDNLTALQIPMSLILKVGSLVKLSTDVGIYTGNDYSLGPSNGGRITLGAALDVKLGPIIAHAGAGFASLLTDEMGMYPTIRDSVYVDLNVKFAK